MNWNMADEINWEESSDDELEEGSQSPEFVIEISRTT